MKFRIVATANGLRLEILTFTGEPRVIGSYDTIEAAIREARSRYRTAFAEGDYAPPGNPLVLEFEL